jgi:hypothetical protein
MAYDPTDQSNIPLSPEQIAQRLALAQSLEQGAVDTSPIRSPWQGYARLAQGLIGGLTQLKATSDSSKYRSAAGEDFADAVAKAQKARAAALASGLAPSSSTGAASPAASALASALPASGGASGDHEAFIRAYAASKGIDPSVAVRVARSEGLGGPFTGDQGSSYGDFQLHVGGLAPGGNSVSGLGDYFKFKTGLDPSDPNNWQEMDKFALDQAATQGWGPWHGAAKVGIGNMQGIGPNRAASAQIASSAPGLGYAASEGAIPVPGYEGRFTRNQATDEEGVPSQQEWDAANSGSQPSRAPMSGLGEHNGGAGPGAQAAPATAQSNAALSTAQPQEDMTPWVRLMQNPWLDPVSKQFAMQQLQRAITPQMQTITDKDGSVWQKDPITGKLTLLQDNSKSETAKMQVIGEDQFGNKQYGIVSSEGKVTPYTPPAAAAQTAQSPLDLHGKEFIQTLDPRIQSQVTAIVEGRAPYPTGMLLKTPYGQQLAAYVTQADPSFESGNATARIAARKEFESGGPNSVAGTITAGNAAIQHLGELSDAAEKLNNTSIPMINSVANVFSAGAGHPQVTNFNNIVARFGEEATKFYRGIGGSEADVQRDISNLNPNMSPDQLRGAIQTQVNLMRDKIQAIQTRWHTVMGPMVPDFPIVSDKTEGVINKVNGRNSPAAEGQAATGNPVHVRTPDEARKLAPGTLFVTPDGRQFTR